MRPSQKSSALRSSLLRSLLNKLNNRALEAIREQLLGSKDNNVSLNKLTTISIALKRLYIVFCAKYMQSALSSSLAKDCCNLLKE